MTDERPPDRSDAPEPDAPPAPVPPAPAIEPGTPIPANDIETPLPPAPPPASPPSVEPSFPTAAAAPAPPPASRLPGILSTLGQSLDLCVAASRDLRRASLYIGVVTLATVGPFAAVLLALGASQGGFDWLADAVLGIPPTMTPIDPGVPGLLVLALVIAFIGYFVVSIEASIMAAAILAGRRLGRPMTMREALRRSRQSFWRVVRASVLVAIILIIPNATIQFVTGELLGAATETAAVISTIIGAFVGAPFAYIVSGVVLGDVDASEAVGRSFRLARARWRLAIAVSFVGVVVAYIQLFALGAGVDILSRVGTVLGVGFGSGVGGTLALTAVVLIGILSVGSLVLTLAALIVAPQVVAFLELTAYGAGISRAFEGSTTPPLGVPWVTGPMGIVIVIGLISGIAGVSLLL